MFDFLLDPQIWTAFLTLSVLEIVLGIDNLIFLSIVSETLPPHQRAKARRIGLILALAMRIGLLAGLTWLIGLTAPLFALGDHVVSWRDLVLGAGGAFLLYKGTVEIHNMVSGAEEVHAVRTVTMGAAIFQIVLLDIVFSLDSVITAIGMVDNLGVMVAAVVVAIVVMLVAADPVAGFIERNPSVKMLALSFLLLVGVALVADGAHFHIPRGYLYVSIAFSLFVEGMNLLVSRRRKRRRERERGSMSESS